MSEFDSLDVEFSDNTDKVYDEAAVVMESSKVQLCTPCAPPPETSDCFEPFIPPMDRIVTPLDVIDIQPNDESVYIIGTRDAKVTCIRGLEITTNLKELTLRACLLTKIEGISTLKSLEKLELYDNAIENFQQLEYVCDSLLILDVSFNSIKDMAPVHVCTKLTELYIAQNKLKQIAGLENMTDLRVLDLGANRLRSMEGLEGLTSLRSLWLGKNKIEKITGVGNLPNLRQLDVQSNRLTSLGEDLSLCTKLEELYVSHNAISSSLGLPVSSPLSVLDISSNKLSDLTNIDQCVELEELWMNGSAFQELDELKPMQALPKLSCLYLEHSPVAAVDDYRARVKSMFPSLKQLDADMYR